MIQFLLILLGLISNPHTLNTSNNSQDNFSNKGDEITAPVDTGGEDGQTPPRK